MTKLGTYAICATGSTTYNGPMRKSTDTTLRNLAILTTVPAYPNSKSTSQIRNELRDKTRTTT